MASGEVDYVETDSPGFVDMRILIRTSYINARLRKRYGNNGTNSTLPFTAPIPEVVLGWLTALVTLDVLRKRGINPNDPQAEMYKTDFDTAMAEIKEAADSKDGLFDLPTGTPDPEDGESSVTTGGPLGYAEASPYAWTNIMARQGRADDRSNRGSGDG